VFFQPRKTLKTRKKAGVVTRGLAVCLNAGRAGTRTAGSQRSVAVFQFLNVSARPGLLFF
jgi:hypothetical protein